MIITTHIPALQSAEKAWWLISQQLPLVYKDTTYNYYPQLHTHAATCEDPHWQNGSNLNPKPKSHPSNKKPLEKWEPNKMSPNILFGPHFPNVHSFKIFNSNHHKDKSVDKVTHPNTQKHLTLQWIQYIITSLYQHKLNLNEVRLSDSIRSSY